MATSINKSMNSIIVICAALLMGSLSSAAWTPQQQGSPPTSDRERRQMLERLTREAQQNRQAGKPTPMPAAQQPQPGGPTPAPATPPAAKPAPPPPASSIQQSSGKVQLSYESVDLYDFVNQISSTLGLTPIVIDPEVKGTVNIQSSAGMSKEDIFPLFNMILKNNNAALIKQGSIYQIVPISSAMKRGIEIIEQFPKGEAVEPGPEKKLPAPAPKATKESLMTPLPATASRPTTQAAAKASPAAESTSAPRLATHVIRVEYVPVRDLIEPIKFFMTDGGNIMIYERLNMLIVTDYSDSAERVLQIVHMLDNNFLDPDLVELVKITYNASADVAEDLKKIFGSGSKDSATGISFVSLDRLNAIFVMASSKRGLEDVKRWIEKLDSASGRTIQTYVYVVENSTASNIAMMISALYGGEGTTGGTSGTAGGGTGTAATGGSAVGSGRSGTRDGGYGGSSSNYQGTSMFGGYQGSQSGGFGGGYMGGSAFGGGQRLGPQLNVSRTVTSQVLHGGAFSGLQDTVRMVVDEINNSIIIQATAADYELLSETIKKMDVLPRQVIIDARLFEVVLSNTLAYGVSSSLQPLTNGSSGEHLTTGAISAPTADSPGGILTANTFAFVGDSRQILLALDALRTKTKVKILEAPSVLALDGTMATIVVGSEIPYPSGTYVPSTGGSTTSIQYRDTGISLLVMPRISATGIVTLDITAEVSSPGTDYGGAPSFSKTSVTGTLSVQDGKTVAIAGLIRDSKGSGRSGVPFLSEIPILGSLFGHTNNNSQRTELIILITPHVIRTPEKFQEATQELKDSLRNVRQLTDEKEKEYTQDIEQAQKERLKREDKIQSQKKPD
jgi:general secretion pathway protein D